MQTTVRARFRLAPALAAAAQVEHTHPEKIQAVVSAAIEDAASQIIATLFASTPVVTGYIDEYNSNPFLDDATLTPSDALLAMLVIKAAADDQTLEDAIKLNPKKALFDSMVMADVCIAGLLFFREYTETVTPSEAKKIAMGLAKAEELVAADASKVLFAKVLADTPVVLENVAKVLQKPFADPVFLGEVINFLIGFARQFVETVTPTDQLNRFNLGLLKADSVSVPDSKAVNLIQVKTDSVSLSDIFAFLHPRAFSDLVSMSPYGGLLNDMALNSGLVNASFGGDRVTLLIAPVYADVTLGSDSFARVCQWLRQYADGVVSSDAVTVTTGKPLQDANPAITDSFLRTLFYGRTPQDANTLLETRLTITTTSVSAVPATLNRGVLNALPLNQEGTFTTISTVQVI